METQTLYNLIHQYRAANGMQEIIPRSPSLDYVAQTHVEDLDSFATETTHSWSNCAYDPNNEEGQKCMWDAPKRLTSYQGNGYEIATGRLGGNITPEAALESWKNSPAHNSVILNQGIWTQPWNAMGVGIYKGYATVWFGHESDPAG
ncbi:CAP domain-containing protein [Microcoleus sp. LAD1_D5]|uniref:CAP domain-containing protein n=1 Tax=unclassified Microcoleus TaxID=2642155 RepID=UPI002FCF0B92